MTANLIRGRVVGEGVKDILLDENQSLKVVQCDEDGEVLGDGTPIKMQLVDGDGDTLTDDTNDALKVIDTPDKTQHTIIDNATFSETVTSADIDVSQHRHGLLTIKTGTATDSPTLTVALKVKDSNGNYITHTTLTAVSTATSTYEEFFYLSASTIQIVCTYGGTGSFATTTVEYTAMN